MCYVVHINENIRNMYTYAYICAHLTICIYIYININSILHTTRKYTTYSYVSTFTTYHHRMQKGIRVIVNVFHQKFNHLIINANTHAYIPKLEHFVYALVYGLATAAMSNQVSSQKEQPKSWNNLTLPENFQTFPAQSPYPAPFSNDPISKAPIQRWHYHHVMSCKSKTNGKHLDALRNWLEVPFVEWAAPGSCSPAMELE